MKPQTLDFILGATLCARCHRLEDNERKCGYVCPTCTGNITCTWSNLDCPRQGSCHLFVPSEEC
jgi:hypothetical protein